MATNKQNFNFLLSNLNKIQEQYPELAIMEAQPIFTTALENENNEDLDLAIIGLHFTEHPEKKFVIWTIICCGSDSRKYAELIQEEDSNNTVLIHDEEGTTSIGPIWGELYTITILAG